MKSQLQFQAKFRTVPTFNPDELTRPKVPTFDPAELLIPPPAYGFKFRPEPAPQPASAPSRPTPPRSAYAILAALSARLYRLDTEQTRGDIAAIMLLFFGEELPRRNVRAFSNFARDVVKGHRFNYTARLFGGLCPLLCEDDISLSHALCQTHLAAFEDAERKASQSGVPDDLDRRLTALLGRIGGQ